MSHWDEERLPADLQDVAERLRENRHVASEFELDSIKTRTMARARSSRREGSLLKSRSIAAVLALALMAGGTGGVIATSGGGESHSSAANSQYKPGCGPKNTNGVNPSGTHTGQPPKAPDRADCPH